jgi:hypothetical protein
MDTALNLRTAIAEIDKHLPGQHDQHSHAGSGFLDIDEPLANLRNVYKDVAVNDKIPVQEAIQTLATVSKLTGIVQKIVPGLPLNQLTLDVINPYNGANAQFISEEDRIEVGSMENGNALIHELGHFADAYLAGAVGHEGMAQVGGTLVQFGTDLDPWSLHGQEGLQKLGLQDTVGKIIDKITRSDDHAAWEKHADERYGQYLMKPHEEFARAFEQYIYMNSKAFRDEVAKDPIFFHGRHEVGVPASITHEFRGRYWIEPTYFNANIAPLFRKLLKTKLQTKSLDGVGEGGTDDTQYHDPIDGLLDDAWQEMVRPIAEEKIEERIVVDKSSSQLFDALNKVLEQQQELLIQLKGQAPMPVTLNIVGGQVEKSEGDNTVNLVIPPSVVTVNIPEQPAPIVNITVPPPDVVVHVPEQPAPQVTVLPANVTVNVPQIESDETVIERDQTGKVKKTKRDVVYKKE